MNKTNSAQNEILSYRYTFTFSNGSKKEFEARLDRKTLNLIREDKGSYPEWAKLGNHKCPVCPLNESIHRYCAIAVNLEDLLDFFKDFVSYEEVDVVIETDARSYLKHTSIQKSVSALLGIYMVTSGCPVMEKLKPMVRYHLPFASPEETTYRAISMYLFAQFFLYKQGKSPDWNLKNLVKIYEDIKVVNKAFFARLSAQQVQDANLNALAILHNFANYVTFSIDENMLSKIRNLFSAYLPDGPAAK